MCTSCDCKCQKKLSLEIGKTYLTSSGTKVKILCTTSRGWFVGEYEQEGLNQWLGDGHPKSINQHPLVKEYKEPVVHKRDIVWYRYHGEMHPVVLKAGGAFPFSNTHELHRQTVEYTEER